MSDVTAPVPNTPGLPTLEGHVVVGAAIVRDGRLLAAQRADPPELAGGWELPGGKVDPGELPEQALARECVEELEVAVIVGERVGPALPIGTAGAVLLAYACTLVDDAEPVRTEHAELALARPGRARRRAVADRRPAAGAAPTGPAHRWGRPVAALPPRRRAAASVSVSASSARPATKSTTRDRIACR